MEETQSEQNEPDIERLRAGNKEHWALAYTLVRPICLATAVRIVSTEDSEDAFQQAMLEI